jgi:hypothetical protein
MISKKIAAAEWRWSKNWMPLPLDSFYGLPEQGTSKSQAKENKGPCSGGTPVRKGN